MLIKDFDSFSSAPLERIRFQDIAENVSKRVDPASTTLDKYIGLEHIRSDNLVIDEFGHPRDVKGTKLICHKGDIIFGKRRAYQRKVGIAPFDCICSAHAMVLRERLDTIAPGFLPYFMHSREFSQRAVAISEGSLSPTIKWKTLRVQTFNIPGKHDQERLVRTLQGVQAYSEVLVQQSRDTEALFRAFVDMCSISELE
jgi:type I restriction enzyme, S subunit